MKANLEQVEEEEEDMTCGDAVDAAPSGKG